MGFNSGFKGLTKCRKVPLLSACINGHLVTWGERRAVQIDTGDIQAGWWSQRWVSHLSHTPLRRIRF